MVWAVEFRLASLAFTPPPTPSDTNSRVVSVLRSLSLKRSSNAVAYPFKDKAPYLSRLRHSLSIRAKKTAIR